LLGSAAEVALAALLCVGRLEDPPMKKILRGIAYAILFVISFYLLIHDKPL
jgi:hypothetical protein